MPASPTYSSNLAALFFLLLGVLPHASVGQDITDEQREFFESRIRPVLIEQCYQCHNSHDAAEADLALDWRTPMLAGGTSGNPININDPANSLLLRVMRHEVEGTEMPEDGPKLAAAIANDFDAGFAWEPPILAPSHRRRTKLVVRPHGSRFASVANRGGASNRLPM